MFNKKIKFVVIGTGHIGKRHAEMIERNEEAELVALIDILPKDKLNLDKFNVPLFDTLEAFFASGIESDVVNICTPNGYHSGLALLALEHKKHVVIEKPMALSKAEAEKVIFKALHAHRQVFCVMQNRYSPPSVWLKEILDQGILGKVYMVQVNCFWNRDDRYYKPNTETGRPGGWHGTKDLDGGTLALHSHRTWQVDSSFAGIPDYLISAISKYGATVIDTPVLIAIEAKKDNFEEGWGQCAAEMVAAQQVNQNAELTVYGVVTNGKLWEFAKLKTNVFTQNHEYIDIVDLDKLYPALHFILEDCKKQLQANLLTPSFIPSAKGIPSEGI